MKPFQSVRLLLLLILPLLLADALQAESSILPGVTYYEGREALIGKLAFLLSHGATPKANSATSASIYEFDLSLKKLRKVTDAPKGLFIPSDRGDAFCVIFRPGNWYHSDDTNVFIWSDATRQSRALTLDGPPKETCVLAGHAFFVVERANGASILDFDIAQGQKRVVEFPGASKWQYQRYDRIHVPRGQTNILHFYYKGYGNRLGDGEDHRDGYYSLDVATGDIGWFAGLLDDKDDEGHTYQASDGRYIFFEGPDAPFRGFKLVSSPWDFRRTKNQDPDGVKVKILKAFSRFSAGGGNAYMVSQMSPDRRYLLVRLQEPSVPKSETQPGWMNTYLLLNTSDGETRVLLKEEVERATSGSISAVHWIR
jgi:hypothetical protein